MTEPVLDIQKKREKNKFILSNVYNLPSIPLVMIDVNRLLDNPMTSASELGKVISKDQGLVTKILTVANSPLYGLPRRVSTIDFAIVILGFDHIKNIVIALSMMEAFKNKSDKKMNQKAYWAHSILTASAAKRIADDLGYHVSGEAFTAGLLHDLGIPVIHKYFFNDYATIVDNVEIKKMTYKSAEEEALGLTHEEIGQLLTQRWNLPPSLADAILHHHAPSKAEFKVLASVVHLADFMTTRLGLGNFNWDDNFEFDQSVIKTLNLGNEEYLEKLILSYQNLFKGQLESLKI